MSDPSRLRRALRDPRGAALAVRRRLAARVAPRGPAPEQGPPPPTSVEVLQAVGARLDTAGRVALTVSCRDADVLPKVDGAGQVFDSPHGPVQRMFNGVDVPHLGYFDEWMADIIETLRGHHEPQEELAFARLLDRIDRTDPVIVELGCFWAFYSAWFLQTFPDGTALACEPDPEHLDVGRATAKINELDIRFEHAAAGGSDDEVLDLPSWNHPGLVHHVPVRTVPTLLADHDLDHVDILHLDIQGAELAVLDSCRRLIDEDRIRFVVVSTHHHTISGDPLTHQRVIEFIGELGGHVIAEHTVLESFSGDGLVVGSFDEQDRGFAVLLSRARTVDALFPSGEQELERFRLAYEELLARLI